MSDLNKAPIPGVAIQPHEDDIAKWNVVIDGPEGTPFIGGKFSVLIDFSNNYPFKPPQMKFVTKIYHPQVKTDTGEFCTQAIENAWVPTLNAKFIIEAIITILKTPNSDNPLEESIAREYQISKSSWEAKAAEWTAQYAK